MEAGVEAADDAVAVDEGGGRVSAEAVAPYDGLIRVDQGGVADAVALHKSADGRRRAGEWRDADDAQARRVVLLVQSLEMRSLRIAISSAGGPEGQQHDLPFQRRQRQASALQPA